MGTHILTRLEGICKKTRFGIFGKSLVKKQSISVFLFDGFPNGKMIDRNKSTLTLGRVSNINVV